MIGRIVVAAVYGIIVALALTLFGPLIASLGKGPFDTLGNFLAAYAWIIGFLVALLAFFRGASFPGLP